MSNIADHILSLEEAVKWRNAMREKNLTVAVTNGCFDLLHRGHAVYLDAARKEADALLVLVNSDESVRALKGPERPLQNEDDRAFLLCSLKAVDKAVIFNSLMACCDVLYYCGSVCWSIGAVPVHYIRSRSAAEVNSYRSNRPGFISELMGKPIVNLLFPYYIRPDKNPGPMCVKEEFYPRPHLVSKILHKEISSTEYQDIRAGTAVVFSFRGRNYKTQTGKNGKCVLPFKLQPLPARHEKITIQLEVEKTNISLKPVSLTQEFPFDTFKLLNPEQKELWAAVQNPELDLQTRIRTMKRLEALFVPAEFLKFTIDPRQYINSLSK